ncbi:MAG: hypothetical protein HXO13_03065 [Prevotella salivae]|nr:hypothetical protein [Segatella salivae]
MKKLVKRTELILTNEEKYTCLAIVLFPMVIEFVDHGGFGAEEFSGNFRRTGC